MSAISPAKFGKSDNLTIRERNLALAALEEGTVKEAYALIRLPTDFDKITFHHGNYDEQKLFGLVNQSDGSLDFDKLNCLVNADILASVNELVFHKLMRHLPYGTDPIKPAELLAAETESKAAFADKIKKAVAELKRDNNSYFDWEKKGFPASEQEAMSQNFAYEARSRVHDFLLEQQLIDSNLSINSLGGYTSKEFDAMLDGIEKKMLQTLEPDKSRWID